MPRKKLKSLPGQLVFDGWIRRLVLRKIQTGDSDVMHLLRVLDDHAYDSTDAWMKAETIADEMCAAKRTAERAIKRAEEAGYLVRLRPGSFWRCPNCKAWTQRKFPACNSCETSRPENPHWSYRNCTTYRIRRHQLARLAGVNGNEAEQADDGDRSANVADAIRQTGGTDPPNRRMRSATLADPKKDPLKTSLKTSPKAKSLFDQPNPRADEWGRVVEELLSYGCKHRASIESAIDQAQAAGCDSARVLELIAFANRHTAGNVRAWGAGALLNRIASDRPALDVDDIGQWMKPADDYAAAAAKRKAQETDALIRRVEWAKTVPPGVVQAVAEYIRDFQHNVKLYERIESDRFQIFDDTAQAYLNAHDACMISRSVSESSK